MKDDTDLDRLERLSRLRESGALTDEEFEAKKQEILSAGQVPKTSVPRWVLWALGAAGLASLAAVIGLWAGSSATETMTGAGAANVTARPTAAMEPEPTPTPTPPSPAELLAFATSESVIGMTPTFLEQKLGTPKEKRPNSLVYELAGCTITYWSDDDEVTTFFFDVTPSCRVAVRGTRIGPDTTFGEVARKAGGGILIASCLANCGNAADPTIDLRFPATRVYNNVGVSFSSDYYQASDALSLWEKAVRKQRGLDEFGPTDDSDAFNCAIDPPQDVKRLANRMKVRTVWVHSGDDGGC